MIGCESYIDRIGWSMAGRWIDLGGDALTDRRPRLDALLDAMREAAVQREVLCLVHNWGRLAAGDALRMSLRKRVVEAGYSVDLDLWGPPDGDLVSVAAKCQHSDDSGPIVTIPKPKGWPASPR
ncbi:hypothetical protein Sgleb_09310 [Streptomyces glebosus]|uniref:Resolvase/invertase-type recombinase catalytic domain-containing protein n=2 Tax=Streptomyces glebosus TaxID=249580 RepID=A0A640SPP7_9ACTN|nr:hypothetical protein Sgleb_09310 [Streptomyces glebosus]GHG57572.1 hypothetical protein GCM10010513_21100 [Streptomyces glebosus]